MRASLSGQAASRGWPAAIAFLLTAFLILSLGIQAADGAPRLALPVAAQKAREFASQTCTGDAHCVRSGVLNCLRERPRVAFCRIFVRRDTRFQGAYRCSRLIRLAPVRARSAKVTGVGAWSCLQSSGRDRR